jgi:hypothetical protein
MQASLCLLIHFYTKFYIPNSTYPSVVTVKLKTKYCILLRGVNVASTSQVRAPAMLLLLNVGNKNMNLGWPSKETIIMPNIIKHACLLQQTSSYIIPKNIL